MDDIPAPNLMSHTCAKLGAAVQTLATHPGDIRARLRAAAEPLAQADPMSMPLRLRVVYTETLARLMKGGSFSSGVRSMRDQTGVRLAQNICSLEAELKSILRDLP